jgi:hypothetical protein
MFSDPCRLFFPLTAPDRPGDRPRLHPSTAASPAQMGAGEEASRGWLALVAAGLIGPARPPRDPAIAANLARTDALFRASRRGAGR